MIDSNVWLYAFMKGNEQRVSTATNIIEQSEPIILSTQIVNEVCFVLLRKNKAKNTTLANYIDYFYSEHRVTILDEVILKTASKLRIEHHFSFWDSLIVASAINNRCSILYSEDMQHDYVIENTRIINPFLNKS